MMIEYLQVCDQWKLQLSTDSKQIKVLSLAGRLVTINFLNLIIVIGDTYLACHIPVPCRYIEENR